MIRHLGILLSALAAGGCTLYQGRPDTPPPPPIHTDYSITRDVVFSPPGWPQSLTADIYQPNGTGPFPAVLVLFGGGWDDRKAVSEGTSVSLRVDLGCGRLIKQTKPLTTI